MSEQTRCQSASTSRRAGYAMRAIAREFKSEIGVPKLELSCGHIKTDPALWYGNATAYAIGLAARKVSGTPRKVRCYECGSDK